MTPDHIRKAVNDLVNSLETITYYKHHYVRKTGLKRKIKDLIEEFYGPQRDRDWDNPAYLAMRDGLIEIIPELDDFFDKVRTDSHEGTCWDLINDLAEILTYMTPNNKPIERLEELKGY